MAAQTYYKVINTPMLEIDGVIYECQTFSMSFNEFIKEHAGKEIYIYVESLNTGQIRAIVINNNKNK
jgi:hypothetical protein